MARLADRVDLEKGDDCWPSIKTICNDCCLSERAVQKHIRDLQKQGFLSVKDGGGRHQVNHYVPFPDKKDDLETVHQEPRIRNPVSGAEKGAPRAGNGAPHAPQPKGTQNEPKGKRPRRYENEILKHMEAADKERKRLFCKSARQNSIEGTKWVNLEDKKRYFQLGEAIENDKHDLLYAK